MSYKSNKKWRLENTDGRNAQRERYYNGVAGSRARSKFDWTIGECDRITAADRPSDRVLAEELGRSVRAIQIQRSRLARKAMDIREQKAWAVVGKDGNLSGNREIYCAKEKKDADEECWAVFGERVVPVLITWESEEQK